MAYLKPVDGYIVDVPNATFTRCDNKVFYYDKLNSCNFSPTMEPIQINGGHSKYPIAFIDAGASAEVQLTSSEFRSDLFELAHDAEATAATNRKIKQTRRFDIDEDLKITLPTGATGVFISGMTLADGVASTGEFTVDGVDVTFFTGDVAVGDTISVTYDLQIEGTVIPVLADGATAKGELQLEYPVYSSGTDCTDASKKGTFVLTVYRVRVSAMPGFDSSYKTAVTNGLTFSVIDPNRADGVMWDWLYIPAA